MTSLHYLASKARAIAEKSTSEDLRELAKIIVQLCNATKEVEEQSGQALSKAKRAINR